MRKEFRILSLKATDIKARRESPGTLTDGKSLAVGEQQCFVCSTPSASDTVLRSNPEFRLRLYPGL
jgi:hypothetical protein